MTDWTAFGIALGCQAAAICLLSAPMPRLRMNGALSMVMILLAFTFECMFFKNYTVDDAYISLRYAQNLHNGLGLTFSVGDSPPLEGFTNFLWVVVESVLFFSDWAPERIILLVKALGSLFGAGSIVLAFLLGQRLWGGDRPGLIAALLYASLPGMALWAVGGLETQMYIFFLLTGLWLHFRERALRQPHVISAIAFLLLAMTRPEGVFFLVGFWAFQVALEIRACGRTSFRTILVHYLLGVAIFGVPFGIYFSCRYGYYGYLFPNSFYAKTAAYGPEDLLHRLAGMKLLALSLLPAVCVAPFAFIKKAVRVGGPVEGAAISMTGCFFLLGGLSLASRTEWMPGHRYELPAAAALLILAAGALDGLHLKWTSGRRDSMSGKSVGIPRGRLAATALLALIVASEAWPTSLLHENVNYTSRLRVCHVAIGKWIRDHVPGPRSVAGFDLGAISFYSGAEQVVEVNPSGLLSTEITHQGYDTERILAKRPDIFILQNASGNAMEHFYENTRFKSSYRLLYSCWFSEGLILDVFARHDKPISRQGLLAGDSLARYSKESL